MSKIGDPVNLYYNPDYVRTELAAGRHREMVGGLWDELGRLQLDFMVSQGLQRHHRLLDVGCGSMRAGVHFVRFLEAGNYFGIDLLPELLDVGYTQEIEPAGLAHKLPRSNLVPTGSFEADFAAPIDFGLAQSVFTHLPAEFLRLALTKLEPVVRPGGKLFVTYFEAPATAPFEQSYRHEVGGVVTYATRDPYHYLPRQMLDAAAGTSWRATIIGEWGHPRDQRMAVYVRPSAP